MQNEFDDHIKKQIDGFKLSPSAQVWDLVEAQLPEKKRRRFIFWWLPLGIILIAFGIYELVGNYKKVIIKTTIVQTNKKIKNDSISNLITINKTKYNSSKKETKISLNNTSKQLNKHDVLNKKIEIISRKENQLNNVEGDLIVKTLADKNIYPTEKKADKNEFIEKEIILKTDKDITAQVKVDSGITNKTIDSTLDKLAQKEITLNKNDTALIKKIKGKAEPHQTKIRWELIAEIGRSNTVGKAFSSSNNVMYDASNNLTASPGTGLNVGNLYSPTAGISFGIDLQRTKQITNKLAWFGSLGYHYLGNHQLSGSLVDSSKIIGGDSLAFLSNNNKIDKVSSYYKYGNNLDHINYVHVLNISVGLKYNISKHFGVYGGATVGYQFYSHWLQPDVEQSILYYSDKLTNKWNIGTKIGFDWQFCKVFSVGAFYNYNFNKASVAAVQQNMHWQIVGVTFSIQLPFKK